jgi:hypothetical protein
VECRLHFINALNDPFQPPVIDIYTVEGKLFEGFKDMIKYQLGSIGNSKVIFEVTQK